MDTTRNRAGEARARPDHQVIDELAGLLRDLEPVIRRNPAYATDPGTTAALCQLQRIDPDGATAWISRIAGAARMRTHDLERHIEAPRESTLDALVDFSPITFEEMAKAELTPRCVVPDLLYADVRTRISAGGTGKTTIAIYEAVILALGRTLWGRDPDGPRNTAIITKEDKRSLLVARMRSIIEALHCTSHEAQQVIDRVRIIDVTGVNFRISRIESDVVIPHAHNLTWLESKFRDWVPDWLIFDPLVSFGVGESRVNDAEQGLIEAFRALRNHLDACIEGIHHSGKANAREKLTDQYSGRGGSALSDGCRMVSVMQPLEPDEWLSQTGDRLLDGQSGIVMALPKLSYAPKQEPIFIMRSGYAFSQVQPCRRSPEQSANARAEQMLQFVRNECQQGRRYALKDLENARGKIGMSRNEVREAVTELKVAGSIVYHEVKGKVGSHFEPVSLADEHGDTQAGIPALHRGAA